MTHTTQVFSSPRQLLEYLTPLDTDHWSSGRYIFRGQPESELRLTSSIHRLEGPVTAPRFYGNQDISCEQQVMYEQIVLFAFLQACDKSGLKVCGDSPEVRDKINSLSGYWESPDEWPVSEMYEVLAFAQHHGVPTCLLDWTRNPYVAAYFAASSALSSLGDYEQQLDGNLAIWAIDTRAKGFDVIQPPGGTSPYLAAQSGVFTVTRSHGFGDNLFCPSPLELNTNLEPAAGESIFLKKLELPRSEARELLSACALFGVSGSSLFPGYEGIAKSVRDRMNIHHQGANPIEDSIRYMLS